MLRLFLAALLGAPVPLRAEPPPLIPRELLFAPPERSAPVLSPSGRLAWIGLTNGLPALFLRETNAAEERLLLPLRRPVADLQWQPDDAALLFTQPTEDGAPHVFQLNPATGLLRDLTPFVGVAARPLPVQPGQPLFALAVLDLGGRAAPFALHLLSGAVEPADDGTAELAEWHPDRALRLRAGVALRADGTNELVLRPDPQSFWRPLLRWGGEDVTRFLGFTPDDQGAYLASSVGTNAVRLLQVSFLTNEVRALVQDPRFDVARILVHPTNGTLDAVQVLRGRGEWIAAHPGVAPDFAALRAASPGDLDVLGRTHDDTRWAVAFLRDDRPAEFALYERGPRRVTPLFSSRPRLAGRPLAATRVVDFNARDGLPLQGYLTLPPGAEPTRLPLVLLVHSGPWTRDLWGFEPEVQWLANRGHAVLQVNYRGSAGYGKAHLRAGFREWGGRMQDDLLDARQWAVDQGVADPARVAIMGAGYGGYAALRALGATPGAFAAGISISGPVNLASYVAAVPDSLPHVRARLAERLGRPGADDALLRERSPLAVADAVRRPVFLAQGALDAQVRPGETDEFIAAARKHGVPTEYLLFPDDGAGITRPANRRRLLAAIEAFLAQHLGGRAEPPAEAEQWERLRR
jgi:dipeptidyl aminopeptidase/acylaminoacyl peptidase